MKGRGEGGGEGEVYGRFDKERGGLGVIENG